MINCFVDWQTVVFRRDIHAEVGYPHNPLNLEASIDWFWVQKMCSGRQTAFIDKPLVRVRAHCQRGVRDRAASEGSILSDRIAIWTHWLLEHPEPPVVSDLHWDRMATIIDEDLQNVDPDDDTRHQVVRTFEALKQAYLQRMENVAVQQLIDVYPFQRECPPWPLDGLKRHSIAWYPDWSKTSWRDTIRFYVESFRSDDPVTLVVIPDIAQDDGVNEAIELVDLELQATAASDVPDILIVPEIQSDFDLACVYAAANAVLVYDTTGQVSRARSMHKPAIETLNRNDWMAKTTQNTIGQPENGSLGSNR
jgi:hypothetical protein